MKKRLQKILAEAGIASRRQSERLIEEGRVTVNGAKATLGMEAAPGADAILVDGKPVACAERKVHFLFHKPAGYLCTAVDARGRRKVTDFFSHLKERVFPVGRLDYDTEGLLIVTNDGELAHQVMHPSFEVTKVYHAQVEGMPSPGDLRSLERGVTLEDGLTAPAEVRVIERNARGALLEIAIHEGRKRQVKRMCAHIGHPVLSLKRVALGPLTLGELPIGKYRALSADELESLRSLWK